MHTYLALIKMTDSIQRHQAYIAKAATRSIVQTIATEPMA